MAGFDEARLDLAGRPAEDYARDLDKPLDGLRIGLPRSSSARRCDAGVMAAVGGDRNTKTRRRDGRSQPCPTSTCRCRRTTSSRPRRASSNLSRVSTACVWLPRAGIRRSRRHVRQTRAQGFGDEVKRRILIGTRHVLSHGYYDAYYLQAQRFAV